MAAIAARPERRVLRLGSLDELSAEIDRVVAAQADGRLRATGRWTPAQICEHLARFIEFSYEGFPFRAAWQIRAISHLAKWVAWKPFVRLALRPGYKLQGDQLALAPDAATEFASAAARFRAAVGRIKRGEPMLAPSPFEGRISHERWVYAHLRHAELHLSFLRFDGADQ